MIPPPGQGRLANLGGLLLLLLMIGCGGTFNLRSDHESTIWHRRRQFAVAGGTIFALALLLGSGATIKTALGVHPPSLEALTSIHGKMARDPGRFFPLFLSLHLPLPRLPTRGGGGGAPPPCCQLLSPPPKSMVRYLASQPTDRLPPPPPPIKMAPGTQTPQKKRARRERGCLELEEKNR